MHQPLHAFHYFDEDSKIGDVDHPPDHLVVEIDLVLQVFPGILGELLDPQGKPFLFGIDVENFHLDIVPFLGERRGLALALAPGQVGYVHQAVDSRFQPDEDAEIRDVAHLALHHAAHGIFQVDGFPGIGLGFFDGQGNPLALHVQFLHQGLHHIAQVEQLGRVADLARPGHFRDVDQPFHAGFQLDEGAIIGETDDFPGNPGAGRVFFRDRIPGIGGFLLEPQGDFFLLRIELEHHHFHFVPDGEHFGRMDDAPPGHVCDVEQPVHSPQIDEDPVIGDVLHEALDQHAFFQDLQGLLAAFLAVHLQQGAPGKHDISALLIEFEDFELEAFADHLVQIAHRTQIHLGAGEECLDPDIHGKPALDARRNDSLDGLAFLENAADLLPDAEHYGLLLGKHHHAVGIFHGFQEHLDLVPDLGGHLAIFILEFLGVNLAFGLVADIDGDEILLYRDDFALDDLVFLEVPQTLLEHLGKIHVVFYEHGGGNFLRNLGNFRHLCHLRGLRLLIRFFGCHGGALLPLRSRVIDERPFFRARLPDSGCETPCFPGSPCFWQHFQKDSITKPEILSTCKALAGDIPAQAPVCATSPPFPGARVPGARIFVMVQGRTSVSVPA